MDAATWFRHLVPDRSVYALLADHRHQLFPPEAFADLGGQGRGHPSVPAGVVASVLVLQALEGLSGREAVSALRRDIAWKVACGLRLDDEGFHPTVLADWRNRIRRSQRPRRVFDAVRQVVGAAGVLLGRRRRSRRAPAPRGRSCPIRRESRRRPTPRERARPRARSTAAEPTAGSPTPHYFAVPALLVLSSLPLAAMTPDAVFLTASTRRR